MADTKEKEAAQSGLDRYFRITARGSSTGREIRGGLTTFLTMVYIVVLNPIILSGVPDNTGQLPRRRHRGTQWFRSYRHRDGARRGHHDHPHGGLGALPTRRGGGPWTQRFVTFGLVGAGLLTWPEAMGLIVIEGLLC